MEPPKRTQPLQYDRDQYDPLNNEPKTPWLFLAALIAVGIIGAFAKMRGWL